jgi:hypothetical protein
MANCTITGSLKNPDGSAAAYGNLRLVRAELASNVILKNPTDYTANASGVVTFTAIQGATIYVYANANGLDINGPKGVPLQVPSSSTANLEDLVTATITPVKSYQFTQASAATTWTITHNLGMRPLVVDLYDTNYQKIVGQVVHTSVNVCTVTFNVAVAGTARLV